ncbi:zona pellucida sperm-binding protein 3 [Chaetodon trifascialis]|uniref:zona pellucida sperm-binding protein 3 n=1 Tax=Chaetodon trifascialis TaxID=109706 RepID=UPI00399241D5
MELTYAGLFLLLFCSAYSYQFRSRSGYGRFVQDPELEWERMEKVIGEDMPHEAPAPETKFWRSASGGSSIPEALKVPEYVIVPASKVQKEVFKPEKGARPLPNSIKEMLLAASATSDEAAKSKLIEILCHVDRMYVRISREVFKTKDAYKYLKLGTCPVNQGNAAHYFLLYLLKTDCGFKKENTVDYRYVSNMLHYKPPGPVLREMPFDIPLQCKFPRFFHSFKVGIYPKLQGGTVFRALQPKSSFTLTPQDASGNEITGAKSYILGQPMYFEVKQPEGTAKSGDQRIYINKCFTTASKDSSSNPKYTVIDNQGCMVDGKVTSQSKFLSGSSKMVQKFSVGSLIFKNAVSTSSSSQQLYMHCEVLLGKLSPTQSSKACNYDSATKKWKELYNDDSVCTCCESTCSSPQTKASRNIISSHSWKIDLSSKDGYTEVDPRMKSLDTDTFGLEDPDLTEHEDFLKYWENDY